MSKGRLSQLFRIAVVSILLSATAVSLTACPEKGEESSVRDGPDNHAPSDHTHGMGMGM
jgi:hypothetical protein